MKIKRIVVFAVLVALLIVLINIDGKNFLSESNSDFNIKNINVDNYINLITIVLSTLGSFLVSSVVTERQIQNSNNLFMEQRKEEEKRMESLKLKEMHKKLIEVNLLINENKKTEFLNLRDKFESHEIYSAVKNPKKVFGPHNPQCLMIIDSKYFNDNEFCMFTIMLSRMSFMISNKILSDEVFTDAINIDSKKMIIVHELKDRIVFVYNNYYKGYIIELLIRLEKVDQCLINSVEDAFNSIEQTLLNKQEEKTMSKQEEKTMSKQEEKTMSKQEEKTMSKQDIKSLNNNILNLEKHLTAAKEIGLSYAWSSIEIRKLLDLEKEFKNVNFHIFDERYSQNSMLVFYNNKIVSNIINEMDLYERVLNNKAIEIQLEYNKQRLT